MGRAEFGRVDEEFRRIEPGGEARSHGAAERVQRLPGEHIDMPGLEVAAGRGAGGEREDFFHDRPLDRPVEICADGMPLTHRVADAQHGSLAHH
jgi:hypothetical protein